METTFHILLSLRIILFIEYYCACACYPREDYLLVLEMLAKLLVAIPLAFACCTDTSTGKNLELANHVASYHHVGFRVHPQPLNATDGSLVHFYCANGSISPLWYINDVVIWQLPRYQLETINIGSEFTGGNKVFFLNFIARLFFNNSQIQCEISSQRSDPVTLLVQGIY